MTATTEPDDCFVLMPISDSEGYVKGHFRRVFDDIFEPACRAAGYRAVRADQVKQTNLIHLDVLQKLLRSPMALCDLSSRNPNVLFELGLRQAFDQPVVLVRENGTPDIFDIAPLRYTEYRKERIYNEVLEDQAAITSALNSTREAFKNDEGINSIVRLLALTKRAEVQELEKAQSDPLLKVVMSEIGALRNEVIQIAQRTEVGIDAGTINLPALENKIMIAESLMNSAVKGEVSHFVVWKAINTAQKRVAAAKTFGLTGHDYERLNELEFRLEGVSRGYRRHFGNLRLKDSEIGMDLDGPASEVSEA